MAKNHSDRVKAHSTDLVNQTSSAAGLRDQHSTELRAFDAIKIQKIPALIQQLR
jgi:hypothetical protein